MIKRIIFLFTALIVTGSSFAQNDSTLEVSSLDVKVGFGFGNKSHFGNFGVSADLFLIKNFSLKLAGGVAAFNYGGMVGSIGCEIPFLYLKKSYFSIGGTWTYIGEGFDLLGDDDSNDYVTYNSSYMKNLKFYCGYSILVEDRVLLTFEGGYSHALIPYHYFFGGPGTPTQKQHDNIQRGLSSGWLASVYINVLWSKQK